MVAPNETGGSRGQGSGYTYGSGISNGANSETGRDVAATTVNGARAENGQAFLGMVPATEPATETPPAPWVGRVIRRNGILPSDIARL
jgi:hypothetical protein